MTEHNDHTSEDKYVNCMRSRSRVKSVYSVTRTTGRKSTGDTPVQQMFKTGNNNETKQKRRKKRKEVNTASSHKTDTLLGVFFPEQKKGRLKF